MFNYDYQAKNKASKAVYGFKDYNPTQRFQRIMNTVQQMEKAGYTADFTAKQYKTVCKGKRCATLNLLRDWGLADVVKVETFPLPKLTSEVDAFMIDNQGQKIMTEKEWKNLPAHAREVIIRMNGGNPKVEEVICSKQGCRYIYRIDKDAVQQYFATNTWRVKESITNLRRKAMNSIKRYDNVIAQLEEMGA